MDAPYRNAEIRGEATTLRRSKWAFVTALAFSIAAGAFAYVGFRYVAAGWIGYAVAGVLAILALLSLSDIGRDRIGPCPRCETPVEVRDGAGYLCPTCKTFLEVDRTQLLASREDAVAPRPVFGVEGASFLHLPDSCCVCVGPSTRKIATKIGVRTLDVPYCAEHERGIGVRGHVMSFRSLPYARATSQVSNVALVGRNDVKSTASDRWLMFFIGALMTGGAAATYFWLSGLEREGYVIVPVSPKGILAWIAIKLLGWGWLALGLMAIAMGCFGAFLGSFKPARKPPAR